MRREVREVVPRFRRGGRAETLVVLDAELRRVGSNRILPGLVLGDLRWTYVDARCVDGRRDETVKNVFEGPFLLLEVALTMGVMKHRRKPGTFNREGQKWWRQLISKPLMWDLRVTVTPSPRHMSNAGPRVRGLEGLDREQRVEV